MADVKSMLRQLPQVDELLKSDRLQKSLSDNPREVVVNCARNEIARIRRTILDGESPFSSEDEDIKEYLVSSILEQLDDDVQLSLRPVVNATGIVLHTNLGRSLLCQRAVDEIIKTSGAYSNLEYDVPAGQRGSRHSHIEKMISDLTGAESAMVVNNNAAATLIVLSALAFGKEVVTSRGELVEIGGSFRVPEIMEQGGAILKEVGTTNRTRAKDYKRAYNEGKTGAFLKVHTSNYRVIGFTEELPLQEMVELAHERDIPAIYDMGSGLFANLSRYGIDEPVIPEVLKTGVDLILFSGDKLLGGPQAGIIIGKKKYIDIIKQHPLARAVRVDKITIAALCATLFEYSDLKTALKRIPTLRMITYSDDELKAKADDLAAKLSTVEGLGVEILKCDDQVGGGSAPGKNLPGYMVAVSKDGLNADEAEEKLRQNNIPVVARIFKDKLCFSVRTLQEGDENIVLKAVRAL